MSTNQPLDTNQPGGSGPPDHECGNNVDAKVYVNGTRVPVTGLDIHMRKEGPLSATRYAEGYIVSPYNGIDYVEAFDAHDGSQQDSYDTVEIAIQDHAKEWYSTQFVGVVTGLGNSGGNLEREWVFRAQGPGLFVDKVTASKTFTQITNLPLDTPLSYLSDELSAQLPLETKTAVSTSTPFDSAFRGPAQDQPTNDGPLQNLNQAFQGPDSPGLKKTFKANRHTLADVADWLMEKYNVRLYFVHSTTPPTLVAIRHPHIVEHDAHYLNGDLYVENNDALSELHPLNTLIAKGSASSSRGALNGLFRNDDHPNQYAQVKVRHKRLYKRAGDNELTNKQIEIDTKSKDAVEGAAKFHLKKQIDNATGGDMQTLPRSPISPYDIVNARPTCRGTSATTVPAVTYEVHRVHHDINSESPSQTVLDVGVHTNVSEDIEVAQDGWKDV